VTGAEGRHYAYEASEADRLRAECRCVSCQLLGLAALRAENERLTQALREITLIGPGDVGDGNRSWSYVLAQARRIARDALEATS
jgi:hypothetical protein